MPGFNVLAARRYLEVSRRVLGEDLELSAVSPEISLSKILDLDPIEDAVHKKVRYWWTGFVPVAANVAGKSRLEVLNPAGSNLLVVIQLARLVNAVTASDVRLSLDAAAGATPAPNLSLDTRQVPISSINRISNTLGFSGVEIDRQAVGVGGGVALPVNFGLTTGRGFMVLSPGHTVSIWKDVVNEAGVFAMFGYERDARPEELTVA